MNAQRFFLGFFLFALGSSMFDLASAVTVENEIEVRASTGGNRAGTVQEGKSEASVFIETKVDGRQVEYIDEKVTGETGEAIQIKKNTSYESNTEYPEPTKESEKSQVQIQDVNGKENIISDQEVETTHEKTGSFLAFFVSIIRNFFMQFFV